MHLNRHNFSGAAPATDPVRFELDGKVITLIPQLVWSARGIAACGQHLAPAQVVGGIEINGAHHVVIAQDSRPEVGPEPLPENEQHASELSAAHLLTRREFEVAVLVANGKCDKEIARTLGISGYTVREHIRRTFAKLGVSRRTAIVSHVLRALSADLVKG